MESPMIDSYLFKDAMDKYNCPPKDRPKALSPELKLLVNKARSIMQKNLDRDEEKRNRGEKE